MCATLLLLAVANTSAQARTLSVDRARVAIHLWASGEAEELGAREVIVSDCQRHNRHVVVCWLEFRGLDEEGYYWDYGRIVHAVLPRGRGRVRIRDPYGNTVEVVELEQPTPEEKEIWRRYHPRRRRG